MTSVTAAVPFLFRVDECEGRQATLPGVATADPSAFAELFETHKDRVYSIALRFSGNPAAASDIAQDTFLKLFSQLKNFRGEASFDSWLYRMVVNACIDHHRRNRRWLNFVDISNLMESFPPKRPSFDIEDALLGAERQTQVQQSVAKLPADLRMVVILRYTEGLAYEEIAGILGCPPGTVASRLNRAHRLLERRLSHLQTGNSR